MKVVAMLHITETDTYPDVEVEVLDGTNFQPSMSPIKIYLMEELDSPTMFVKAQGYKNGTV